jgi:hypothetical protein
MALADRNPLKKGTACSASKRSREFSKEPQMRHLILALLAATFSLSVTAATNLNSSRSNITEEATTVKSSKSNTSDREQALQGADTCQFTIDQAGVKRQATEAQKQKCQADRKIKDAVVK